ncbi:RNA polymerase sigma factor [Lunatibacter salilacus]|uniref:RNA polymerase sigma factor n=1 Tax=Lunatibacter salilacus TaxID=2483804 RepID=UPI00131E7C05|nr:sigma-70 family RNA polymerase sigma factor [Lunatibacter salilacus]
MLERHTDTVDQRQDVVRLPADDGDSKLWEAFCDGKESAFIQIYERYFETLYRYGLRMVADQALVEDTIQDMFIYLRASRSRLGKTTSIKFYLFKCLKRRLLSEVDKWAGKRDDFPPPSYFAFSLSHEQHLIQKQLDAEKLQKLNEAIAQMSSRKKEIIYYSFYEGLDYRQIQELMGLDSLKTTRNLMYKALGFLREALSP